MFIFELFRVIVFPINIRCTIFYRVTIMKQISNKCQVEMLYKGENMRCLLPILCVFSLVVSCLCAGEDGQNLNHDKVFAEIDRLYKSEDLNAIIKVQIKRLHSSNHQNMGKIVCFLIELNNPTMDLFLLKAYPDAVISAFKDRGFSEKNAFTFAIGAFLNALPPELEIRPMGRKERNEEARAFVFTDLFAESIGLNEDTRYEIYRSSGNLSQRRVVRKMILEALKRSETIERNVQEKMLFERQAFAIRQIFDSSDSDEDIMKRLLLLSDI